MTFSTELTLYIVGSDRLGNRIRIILVITEIKLLSNTCLTNRCGATGLLLVSIPLIITSILTTKSDRMSPLLVATCHLYRPIALVMGVARMLGSLMVALRGSIVFSLVSFGPVVSMALIMFLACLQHWI